MEPTHRVENAEDSCPDCGNELSGGWPRSSHEVIDIPRVKFTVTEHASMARKCSACRKAVVARPDLGGIVMGKQRLGIELIGHVVTLRQQFNVPLAKIQWYLETMYGLTVSAGAFVDIVHRVADVAQAPVEEILERMRNGDIVAMAETGWGENGAGGYAWVCVNKDGIYFVRGDRSKSMVQKILGPEFVGVLVADYYAAYNHVLGEKQRCWAHLLRAVSELWDDHPDNRSVKLWVRKIKALYTEAKAFESRDVRQRAKARQDLEQRALKLTQRYADDGSAPQRTLSKRVKEPCVFAEFPFVPPGSNISERSLRALVAARKMGGGTRSTMTLFSLFGTWNRRGENPLAACQKLLASHTP